ncbi:MAG: response regulator transcription factor [Magnetovibrionaceae bacterium]
MRVIIAEDRSALRSKLQDALSEASGEDKDATVDFVDLDNLPDDAANLLIVDVAGDGDEAREALSAWRDANPDAPVLLLADGLTPLGEGKVGRLADAVLPRSGSVQGLGAMVSKLLSADEEQAPKKPPLTRKDAGKALEGLTKREREVLGLLTQGFSNRDIADALGLREITVKVHLKSVYRKLSVKSRTQAIRIAMDVANGKKPRRQKADNKR